MLEVICALYTFHQYIISIHLHGVPNQVLEDLVYHPLEGNPCVLESKGHHLVAVDSLTSGKVYYVLIWWGILI